MFVPGCPNYEPAVERVKNVLAAESLNVYIRGVAVRTEKDARVLSFPGSPTIRVNGEDVEPDTTNVSALSCRLYSNRTGIPSEEVIRLALLRAKGRE